MGSAQSRAEAQERAQEKELLQRLRVMAFENRSREACSAGQASDEYEIYHDDKLQYSTSATLSPELSLSLVQNWGRNLFQDPKNRLALAALSTHHATDVLSSRATVINDSQNFNIKIPFEVGPVTNQRSSGRCWLFASTNVFRVALARRYNLEKFQLSQAYLFFWDKIEKANFFLMNIIQTSQEPLDARIVRTLMASPVGDGGQWDMVANLVEKYGLVPHSLYPDSFNAMNSNAMCDIITTKLREDALRLRTASTKLNSPDSISVMKEKMLKEIYLILSVMLGPPPSPDVEFKWEFTDKDGSFNTISMTPVEFSKQLSDPHSVKVCAGTDVHRLFSLVNDPRNPYMSLLTVNRLGNVYGGRPVTYVNVDIATMKTATIRMLRRGIPVFFGSDVGKYSDSAKGIMDLDLYDYELAFNIRLRMNKAERLNSGESSMTHAMVLTGVHVDQDGKPVRWRVENSWSENVGSKGYFVMSDRWMDEFVYQVVVDPAFVDKEVKKVLEQKPIVLDLWDPMGSLA